MQDIVDPNTTTNDYVYCNILSVGEIDGSSLSVKNLAMCGINTNTTLLNSITNDAENHFK